MSVSSKHSAVSVQLRAEIAEGKYERDRRFPSEAQLVKRFGVSRPTIARALRDLQVAGLLERRAGSGTYLRDLPSQPQALLPRPLGLIMPDLGMVEIFDEIAGELASLSRTHEMNMLWGGSGLETPNADGNTERMLAECSAAISRGCIGAFFAPIELTPDCEKASAQVAERLRKAGIPVVLIDRDFASFPERSDFDLISVDHFRGGFLVARHLIKLGCRNVAFVRRPYSATAVDARIAGARAAFQGSGIEIPPDFVQTGEPSQASFVRNLMAARRFDALICANDRTAAMVIQGLTRLNLKVPHDVKVVGFDDLRYATLLSVPLTTIHQPCRDIASVAFRALLERMANPTLPPRLIHLTPHLVIRESCGAYLQG